MNMITKRKHRRSRPFRMSLLLGALSCAFLTTTEKAFSEIILIAANLAWVPPPVLVGSVTLTAPPPGWSSTTPVTSSAATRTPTPRPRPTPRPSPTPNPTPTPTPGLPAGVFSLTGFGRQIRGSTLSNPDVDGISVRDKWWHLEPSEGVYDWSTLDAYVAQIAPSGKKILIRIGTMGGRHSLGGNTPDWVMDAVGANTISFYDSGHTLRTIPLFWNQTFLDKKKAMIAAVGARYSGNRLVKVATASFANRNSEDWSVPDSTQIDGIPPAGSSEVTRMLAAGYTHQKMVDAGTQIMDAAMTAWPNQAIYIAIGRIDRPLEQDPDSVARDVRDATRSRWGSTRLVIGKETISNVMPFAPPDPTSVWELFYLSRPAIAGQNLTACYGSCQMNGGNCHGLTYDQILRGTVDHFVSYGGQWLEIYDDDVTNLPGAIHYAHQLIGH
jgi:Beta-galactosidase